MYRTEPISFKTPPASVFVATVVCKIDYYFENEGQVLEQKTLKSHKLCHQLLCQLNPDTCNRRWREVWPEDFFAQQIMYINKVYIVK
jgi:hypothetical protein